MIASRTRRFRDPRSGAKRKVPTSVSRPEKAKIRPLPATIEQVARWREQGLTIGFTNGCFDILHAGHVSYLAQARENCDRLIVGLNTDESVRRLKGDDRPVNHEKARAIVLAALEAVDGVVLFSEATPVNLIEALRPEVYIKGADYTEKELVEADVVRSYGGRVFLAQLEPEYSTTSTIDRINRIKG
jgi:D-beta-D-heptose 7-phosphate kinase/D-beta-D-heptose 1-phosphate adenosyltransferase